MAVTGRIPTLIDLTRSRERSGRFVGRADELAALRTSWPPVTLIFGEPGGGKTRLLAEAARAARVSAISVTCHPSATSVPLEPLLDVIRHLQAATPLSSDWQRPSEARRLLAIRDHLERAASPGLLIQVDDAHWADEQTLDAVAYLADRLRRCPVRWHIAARAGDDRLERLAIRISQLSVGDTVRLREFGIGDFRSFVTTISERPLDDAAIAELYALSGGNPLYAEQLIIANNAGETSQQTGLTALLADRIQSLSDPELRVARAIAVDGEPIQYDVLSDVSGVRGDALSSVVLSLEAKCIAKTSSRGVQFQHDLIRRACYARTPNHIRVRLHAGLSEVQGDVWRRVRHLDGAGMRGEAALLLLHHGLAMIDRADRVEAKAALEGSARRGDRALEIHAQAMAGLAALSALDGDVEDALEAMRSAESSIAPITPEQLVDMRCRFAEALLEGTDDMSAAATFVRLAIADAEVAAPGSLARLYTLAGAAADRSGNSIEAEEMLRRGVDTCCPSTPARDRVRLLSWTGVVKGRLGDPKSGLRVATAAAETALVHRLSAEYAQACLKCCYLTDLIGDRQAYEDWCRRGLECDGVKLPRVTALLRLNLATALGDRGALAEALQVEIVAHEEASNGSAALRAQADCSLALGYAMLGRFAEAEQVIADLTLLHVSDRWRRAIEFASGRVAEMSGDLEGALDAYERVAAASRIDHSPEGFDVRAKAGEARVLYALGRFDDVKAVWEFARAGFERGWPLGASLRSEIEGYALIADGRIEEGAAALLTAAKSSKERFRAAYLTASAGLAKTDRDLINTAIGELEEMGAHAASEGIRRKAHGIGLRPRHRPRSKRAVTTSDMRIASLIRAGKTNAEIGSQLGLSTKTVEHYVSNMLAKFGLRSRAQLAATIGSDAN